MSEKPSAGAVWHCTHCGSYLGTGSRPEIHNCPGLIERDALRKKVARAERLRDEEQDQHTACLQMLNERTATRDELREEIARLRETLEGVAMFAEHQDVLDHEDDAIAGSPIVFRCGLIATKARAALGEGSG